MKPRSELNPGVWQGDCFPVLIRIARKCFGDRECRCWYSGGQTLIALRIAQKFRTRRWALHAFPMRRATAVRNRPDKARRRLFRLGRDRVEFERCCLTRRRGDAEARRNTRRTSFPDWLPSLQGYAGKSKPASAETAEIVRLRSEAHAGVEG